MIFCHEDGNLPFFLFGDTDWGHTDLNLPRSRDFDTLLIGIFRNCFSFSVNAGARNRVPAGKARMIRFREESHCARRYMIVKSQAVEDTECSSTR